jgi:hypothetical protein
MVVSLYNEKRDTVRVRSIHLLSYSQIDVNHRVRDIGMARTLNISETGVLMEVHSHIPRGSVLEILLNVAEECITVKGKVMREAAENGRWRLAVEFTQISPEGHRLLAQYLDNNYPYTRISN